VIYLLAKPRQGLTARAEGKLLEGGFWRLSRGTTHSAGALHSRKDRWCGPPSVRRLIALIQQATAEDADA